MVRFSETSKKDYDPQQVKLLIHFQALPRKNIEYI